MTEKEFRSVFDKVSCSKEFSERMEQKLTSSELPSDYFSDSVNGVEVTRRNPIFRMSTGIAACLAFLLIGCAAGMALHDSIPSVSFLPSTSESATKENPEMPAAIDTDIYFDTSDIHYVGIYKQPIVIGCHFKDTDDPNPSFLYREYASEDGEIFRYDELGRLVYYCNTDSVVFSDAGSLSPANEKLAAEIFESCVKGSGEHTIETSHGGAYYIERPTDGRNPDSALIKFAGSEVRYFKISYNTVNAEVDEVYFKAKLLEYIKQVDLKYKIENYSYTVRYEQVGTTLYAIYTCEFTQEGGAAFAETVGFSKSISQEESVENPTQETELILYPEKDIPLYDDFPMQDLSGLSEEQLIEVGKKYYDAAFRLQHPNDAPPYLFFYSKTDEKDENGLVYALVADDHVKTVEDVRKDFYSVFTSDWDSSIVDQHFTVRDGKLYYRCKNPHVSIHPSDYVLELDTVTENEIYYSYRITHENILLPEGERYKNVTLPFTLKRTEEGWKVSVFMSPFDVLEFNE
ncbi:MAG: hypothetical protein E7504_01940 [Ruminococcus sp.]|nr:hypothetical protein [Ruminococcus sp.]